MRLLQILNTLRMATFDPVILHAIKTNTVVEQDALFKKLECFVIRNYILKNSTRSYNTYAIDMIRGNFDFDAALSNPDMSDERVRTALRNIDNKRAGLILFWIELHRHLNPESDLYNVELTYTFEVEHVMPQSWDKHWGIEILPVTDDAGNILQGEQAVQARNKAIYEIGNMTLLKSRLNKVLQNDAFADKVNGRKIGRRVEQGLKAHTAFSITREVIDRDPLIWDESRIHKRTKRLIDEFITIWPCTGI